MPTVTDPVAPRLRAGIVVLPDGETGTGRVVKDPRTRRYYRFDALEAAILDRLDGEHTAVDIQVELATLWSEEFALDEIQDFLDTLRDKGLLEPDGRPVPARSPELGQQVVAALEAGGFALAAPERPGLPARVDPAAERLAEAVGCLRDGRFAAALRIFDEILAADPHHARAAALRQVLLQAGAASALELASRDAAPARSKSALYYQVPLVDPDRLLSRLAPFGAWIFTPAFAAGYVLLVLGAGYVALRHAAEIFETFQFVPGWSWTIALLLVAVFATALHEMAHGLTCKHYGGRVQEMGFLLILFSIPALYADVSDAWLMRDRRQRALVGLAGPLWDLGLASAAILAWRVQPPGLGRFVAVLLATACTTSVLVNLNPLIKLDGYYVLSDLSGIPNLRAAAGRLVARVAAQLAGRPVEGPAPTGRATLFLLAYGLLSAAYTAALLGLLFAVVFRHAAQLAGLWGPAAITVGVLVVARRPLALATRAAARAVAGITPRGMLKLAAIGAAAAALALWPVQLKIGGPAALDARARVALRPEVSGKIAEILVREGERVAAGQVVARLDTSELLAQLTMTRADVQRAQANLDLTERGPEIERVRQAREDVVAARTEVNRLRSQHARLGRLRQEGLVSAESFEQVGSDLEVREAALRAANQQAQLVERGPRPELVAGARAEVARLTALAADVERRLAACTLAAPTAGTVLSAGLDKRVGEYVPAGGLVLELAGEGGLVADVLVQESEIGDVAAGRPVQLRLTAFPDRIFEGAVLEIAPLGVADRLGRTSFRVRSSVSDPSGL
ncbi:MAG: HlyD family efflux transporter periplasmic adaptor subunit, partial [Acidobacteria bacterium]|nr:HlyD family efflux transporter periplasmic adaptor subunit [Acidobacteriota bacterium]